MPVKKPTETTRTKTSIQKITESYLKKYPEIKDYTLAKKMYNENKEHFMSFESARSVVRRYRHHSAGSNTKDYNPFDSADRKEAAEKRLQSQKIRNETIKYQQQQQKHSQQQ